MPNPLDTLYTRGTSKAFKEACQGATVETEIDGGVRVYVDWDDGSSMKIDCTPIEVNFQHLNSNREGLYSHLCDVLPDLFKSRGVREFRATAANEESDAILRKRGEWNDGPKNSIRWIL